MLPITPQDLFLVLFLVFLEGILSIDNALVLAMMARHLPPHQQRKALTYGLVGAIVFRLISLALVTHLIKWTWVKYVGGGYLIFIAARHFLSKRPSEDEQGAKTKQASFWKVVLMIELTDIAFAVDSILAAVALTSKFWVIFTGGILGIITMRFAATMFIKVLNRFPNLENTAYQLVLLIGIKLILEALRLPALDFHSAKNPAFWIFWSIMAGCIIFGFKRGNPKANQADQAKDSQPSQEA